MNHQAIRTLEKEMQAGNSQTIKTIGDYYESILS